jgi:hypothetical protein
MVVAPFLGFKPFSFYITRSDFRVCFFPALMLEQTVCQRQRNFSALIYYIDIKENISEIALLLE